MKTTPFTVRSALFTASISALAACSPNMSTDVVTSVDVMDMDRAMVDVVADLGPPVDRPTAIVDTGPQCPAGSALCDGMCANLQTDRSHCGACGTRCGAGLVCSAGRCAIECVAGLTACAGPVDADAGDTDNRTCVDLATDPRHCGGCGAACAVGESCVASRCVRSCTAGLTLCGGSCRDTQNDPNHCGMCGQSCPSGVGATAVCSAGRCAIVCAAGVADCNAMAADGCETMLNTVTNCRACGVECRFANASSTCEMSGCALGACNAGFANCNMIGADGCESNTASDPSNCGACGRSCGAGEVCSMGVCTLQCAAGLSNCGGSCRNVANDIAHCGMCGMACSAAANQVPVCAGGSCSAFCSANFDDCNRRPADGCESDLRTDSNNCGACGTACVIANGAGNCQASTCRVTSCNGSFRDCNSNAADGCETDTSNTLANCGACGNACAAGDSCIGGTCVTAATSPAPVIIPNSSGCSLLGDSAADQIDVSPGGVIFVAMHCYGPRQLRVSVSTDLGRTFSAAAAIPGLDWPGALGSGAAIYARTDREVLLHVGSQEGLTRVLRSTDQGRTWTAPRVVGRPFLVCNNGSGLSIHAGGPNLFAAWSHCSNFGRIAFSSDNGITWDLGALPLPTLAGNNEAPDLFQTLAGDLVYATEVSRAVFVLPAGAPNWVLLGSLGTNSTGTDFAAGGPWIYAVGSGNTVTRGLLSAMPFALGSLSVVPFVATNPAWSVDADPTGNLALATINATNVNLYSWPAGAAAMNAPIVLNVPNPGLNVVATTALRQRRASATAIWDTAFVGGHIAVHVQVF